MTSYNFKTANFGINAAGIHLLRNGFNYTSYEPQEITSFTIRTGKGVKNWFLLFGLGTILCLIASYHFWEIYRFFSSDSRGVFYVEELLVPIALLTFGSFSLFMALKKTLILELTLLNKKEHFPIKDFSKE